MGWYSMCVPSIAWRLDEHSGRWSCSRNRMAHYPNCARWTAWSCESIRKPHGQDAADRLTDYKGNRLSVGVFLIPSRRYPPLLVDFWPHSCFLKGIMHRRNDTHIRATSVPCAAYEDLEHVTSVPCIDGRLFPQMYSYKCVRWLHMFRSMEYTHDSWKVSGTASLNNEAC